MNLVLPVQLDLVLHAHHAIKDIFTLQPLVHVYLAVVLDITHHHPLPALHVILHVLHVIMPSLQIVCRVKMVNI